MISKALRRSISVSPSASSRSSSTERISEPSWSFWLRVCACSFVVEFAFDPVGGAVEQVDGGPEQVFEVGFEARVGQGGDQGVEDVGQRGADGASSGSGLASGSSWKGRWP